MDDNDLNKATAIARRYAASNAMPDVKLLAETMLYLDAKLGNVTHELICARADNETLSESLDSAVKLGHMDAITVDYMRKAIIHMFPQFAFVDSAND